MKRQLLNIIATVAFISTIGNSLLPIQATFAADSNNTQGSTVTDKAIDCNTAPPAVQEAAGCHGNNKNELPGIIQAILNSVILVCGLVAVAYIIVGGYNYMTSSGDANKVEKAKKTIMYALIGLIVCALSFIIVNWAINIVTAAQ